MKVAIFTKQFPDKGFIGGAEIQAYLLAKYLTLRNHQISYLAFGDQKNQAEKKDGFTIKYIAGIKDKSLNFVKSLHQSLKKDRPDIFFIRDFRYLFLSNLVCKNLKIPLVYNTTHINNCQPYPKKIEASPNPVASLASIKAGLMHYLNFVALKKVNLITINKYHARLLKDKYNITATPIYNSMEDNYEKNKLAKKENIVVWVANLKTRKRPELYIQLADQLKHSNYKFIMIGYIQNNLAEYEKMIQQTEKNNPNFKYLGGLPTDQVDQIMAKAKIFVNTCLPEGFGNNFIQAWFNECPTVTLDFDPDDIIKNNGIGCHSRSFEQMVKDVEFLTKNEAERLKMGKKAREYALEYHLPQNNVLKYESFFKNLIAKDNYAKKIK